MPDLSGRNQAETMLRRVSSEGREQVARERQRRRKRTAQVAGRIAMAAAVAVLALLAVFLILGTLTTSVTAAVLAMFLLAALAIAFLSRARPIAPDALPAVPLAALPGAAAAWLESQHPALPAPAATLTDSITAHLRDLEPQLGRLDGNEPAADAVRRLLATELPDLIDRHQRVPAGLRTQPRESGQSVDAHLIHGLRIVDEEIARLTTQLAAGDMDALATRQRFLELKYQGQEMLR